MVMETSCYITNEITYVTDSESLYISPKDILIPNFNLNSLASITSPLRNVNLLIQKYKIYHIEIHKILEQLFLSDWRRFGPGQIKVHKSRIGEKPREGDLVLVKGDKLSDP